MTRKLLPSPRNQTRLRREARQLYRNRSDAWYKTYVEARLLGYEPTRAMWSADRSTPKEDK